MVMKGYTPIDRNYSRELFDYCLYLLSNCLDDTLTNHADSPHTPHLGLYINGYPCYSHPLFSQYLSLVKLATRQRMTQHS